MIINPLFVMMQQMEERPSDLYLRISYAGVAGNFHTRMKKRPHGHARKVEIMGRERHASSIRCHEEPICRAAWYKCPAALGFTGDKSHDPFSIPSFRKIDNASTKYVVFENPNEAMRMYSLA